MLVPAGFAGKLIDHHHLENEMKQFTHSQPKDLNSLIKGDKLWPQFTDPEKYGWVIFFGYATCTCDRECITHRRRLRITCDGESWSSCSTIPPNLPKWTTEL